MSTYLQLLAAGMVAVVLSVGFYFLQKKTKFGDLPLMTQQVIIGIFFGGAAVLGTEFGIQMNGAQVNARDAAVISAGLVFGGPAGIIAGLIGGIERWFAVYWGVGTFTRTACSVSTILAGFFTALLRKYIFDDDTPKAELGLLSGLAVEVFHMMMVFLTNLNEPLKALDVIRACTFPMVIVNSLSVFAAVLVVTILREGPENLLEDSKTITAKIVRRLLFVIITAFCLTIAFTYVFQGKVSDSRTTSDLKTSLNDIQADINDESDRNLIRKAREITGYVRPTASWIELKIVAESFGVSEINIVDQRGVIIASSNPDYLDFDMASGEQAAEFLCLLTGIRMDYVQDFQRITADSNRRMKYAAVVKDGGFVQIGYDSEMFHRDLAENIAELTVNRHIGENGYVAIEDNKGSIYRDLEPYINENPQYTKIRAEVKGVDSYVMYTVKEGYYIFAIVPVYQANMYRDMELYLSAFIEILLFAALFIVLYFIIKSQVVDSIRKVNESMKKITNGDLEERVEVRNASEFSKLSDGINHMVDRLKEFIAEAAARLKKDLDTAERIQRAVLPTELASRRPHEELDIYALMDPAKEVGGDFYDTYWVDKDEKVLSIMISDVSGKGIPGAMFMMRAKTMMKSLVEQGLDVAEVFEKVNEGLCEGNDADMFVTSWLGFVYMETGHVEYVNAGHNPPLVRHAGQQYEYLKGKPGFVLAGMEGMKYKKQEFDVEPGSVIYLYTDGAPEAHNAKKELFGEERLRDSLNRNIGKSMKETCINVKLDIDHFADGVDQFDDITMLALKLNETE